MFPQMMTTVTALALLSLPIHHASAAPFDGAGDTVLSIRAVDIANDQLDAYATHPLMGIYSRWIEESPYASFITRNTSSVVERFPTLSSIDCYADTKSCMLTSRMAMSSEETDSARAEVASIGPRGLFWDINKLEAEIHYKTYHWLECDGERHYAGFETYITYDWKCKAVIFRSSGGMIMASHRLENGNTPGVSKVGYIHTTVTYEGPTHNEILVATFSCGLFSNKCCLNGGYEELKVEGEYADWAAKPERTCNHGRQKSEECPKED